MDDRDLVQFVNGEAHVIEKDHIFYIGPFSEDLTSNGTATAYYPNGISITGNFQSSQPVDSCEITYGATGITETVKFSNGHRTNCATATYPSGLVVKKTLNDASPFLFQSVIPYGRNFYNHSIISFPCGTPSLHAITRGSDSLSVDGNLGWLLCYFDVQQPVMNVNLSCADLHGLKKHIPPCVCDTAQIAPSRNDSAAENAIMECEGPHASEEPPIAAARDLSQSDPGNVVLAPSAEEDLLARRDFYRVESATLCWGHVIAKNRFNYSLPEIPSLRAINCTLIRSVERCRTAEPLTAEQKEVCATVLDVLNYGERFHDLTLVAWAEDTLDLGSHAVFSKLRTLTLKSTAGAGL